MDTTSMSPQSFCSEVYNGVFPDYIPVPSHDQPMFQDTNYALVPQTEIEDSFGRSTFQGHTFCSNHQQVTLFPFGVFGNHGLNYDTFPLQEPYLQQQWGFGDDQIPSLTILPSFPISHESTTSDFLGFRSQGPECTSSPEGSPSSLLDYNTFEMNDDGCSNFAIECNTLITYPDPRGIIDLTQNTENHELNGQCVAHPETFSMMTINTPPHEVQQLGESISDFSELDECTPKIDVSKRKKQYRKKITTTAKPILPKLTYHKAARSLAPAYHRLLATLVLTNGKESTNPCAAKAARMDYQMSMQFNDILLAQKIRYPAEE
ncbi:hypothetical protein BGZ46_002459 [Entomortierella lignicola]|nr:hypothetical protein BGZ46_002459 [Entomortierella lignicola]